MAEIALYHGTNTLAATSIRREGLDPARSRYDWELFNALDHELAALHLPEKTHRRVRSTLTVLLALGKGWTNKVSFFDDFNLARAWARSHRHGSETADEEARIYAGLIDGITNPYGLGDPDEEPILREAAKRLLAEETGAMPDTISDERLREIFQRPRTDPLSRGWLGIAQARLDAILARCGRSQPAVLTVRIEESLVEKGTISYLIEEGVRIDTTDAYKRRSHELTQERLARADEELNRQGYCLFRDPATSGLRRAPVKLIDAALNRAFAGTRKAYEWHATVRIPPEQIRAYTIVGRPGWGRGDETARRL